MEHLDARGLSCPEPVMLLRRAMASQAAGYEILVDNHAAKENVTRYAEHQGYRVTAACTAGVFTLTIER